jgi:hypothetical protein
MPCIFVQVVIPKTPKRRLNQMAQWTTAEADQVLEQVIKRSMEDPEFRALALNDAGAAIAQLTAKPLPAGFSVRFVDNGGASRTFVLPDAAPINADLSDAELEQVAGGLFDRCGNTCNTTCANGASSVKL